MTRANTKLEFTILEIAKLFVKTNDTAHKRAVQNLLEQASEDSLSTLDTFLNVDEETKEFLLSAILLEDKRRGNRR